MIFFIKIYTNIWKSGVEKKGLSVMYFRQNFLTDERGKMTICEERYVGGSVARGEEPVQGNASFACVIFCIAVPFLGYG